MALFPKVRTKAEYVAALERRDDWLPGIRAICERHGLPTSDLRPLPIGSNVCVRAGNRVVKTVAPLWPREARAERAMLQAVEGRLGLETPRLDASGEVEGWPYLVMSFVEGRSAKELEGALSAREQTLAMEDLGRAMARLHALRVPDVDALDRWPDVVRVQRDRLRENQRTRGMAERWVDEAEAWLDGVVDSLAALPARTVHADVTWEHVLFTRVGGLWRLTGLIDFADALVAPVEMDLLAPPTHWFPGRPDLLRTLCLAYGMPASALTPALSDRLLACALLHRFAVVSGAADRAGGVLALRSSLYSLT